MSGLPTEFQLSPMTLNTWKNKKSTLSFIILRRKFHFCVSGYFARLVIPWYNSSLFRCFSLPQITLSRRHWVKIRFKAELRAPFFFSFFYFFLLGIMLGAGEIWYWKTRRVSWKCESELDFNQWNALFATRPPTGFWFVQLIVCRPYWLRFTNWNNWLLWGRN